MFPSMALGGSLLRQIVWGSGHRQYITLPVVCWHNPPCCDLHYKPFLPSVQHFLITVWVIFYLVFAQLSSCVHAYTIPCRCQVDMDAALIALAFGVWLQTNR